MECEIEKLNSPSNTWIAQSIIWILFQSKKNHMKKCKPLRNVRSPLGGQTTAIKTFFTTLQIHLDHKQSVSLIWDND